MGPLVTKKPLESGNNTQPTLYKCVETGD